MAKDIEEINEKKSNKFQMFLFVFFIPILFLVTVGLVVLSFAGVNVFEASKELGAKIPIISSFIAEEPAKTEEEWEKNIIALEGEIKDREAKIEKLETEIESKEQEVARSTLEKEQLQQQIDELTAIQEENKRAFKDIVKTYETMSAKKAAPIITAMTEQEALKILKTIKADKLAAIMESMSAEKAAKFTELLTAESEKEQ